MKTSIVGYPRIGELRQLKFAVEKYFKGQIAREELQQTAADLRSAHWDMQRQHGIDLITSNDFSFYDGVLDTACLLNIIPQGIVSCSWMSWIRTLRWLGDTKGSGAT